MSNVTLYSTGCPLCETLKEKLENKKIQFTEINDKEYMIKIGITKIPILEVDGEKMEFSIANKWINKQ